MEQQRHILGTRGKGKKALKGLEVPIQEVSEVSKLLALKGINLDIPTGAFVCIIGDVGSGKSSLLSSMIGDMLYVPKQEMNGATLDGIKKIS